MTITETFITKTNYTIVCHIVYRGEVSEITIKRIYGGEPEQRKRQSTLRVCARLRCYSKFVLMMIIMMIFYMNASFTFIYIIMRRTLFSNQKILWIRRSKVQSLHCYVIVTITLSRNQKNLFVLLKEQWCNICNRT